MIKHISHTGAPATGPDALTLALAIAHELHPPAIPAPRTPEAVPTAQRAPEVVPAAVPQLMGLRTPAVRTHRRKVPLNRLSVVRT
ncbi:hypothetical protein [Streptomyces sp. NPDC127190]|uniref:hypothetical protein n=1 Tax=unclassified Streptomyces TaxID=2593676 RepID=UPI0036395EED